MKTKRMNKAVKAKWIKALRSGKYKQCKGQLKKGNKFCCLGVLTDLWRYEVKPDWDSEIKVPSISGEYSALPKHVCEWAGLIDSDPIVMIAKESTSLAALNDDGCEATGNKPCNFKQIADIIQKKL